MKESSKILLYGLLASIALILLCLYTHQDEFKNEIKEIIVKPMEVLEKKEEVVKPFVAIKPIVQEEPLKQVKGIEEVLKTSPEVVAVKKVVKINETEDINKTESNVSNLTNNRTSFKKKELVTLTERPKAEKVDTKVEMSDKNLPTKDNYASYR